MVNYEDILFNSQGAEASVQALYNGFTGSLHGPGQTPNQGQPQAQHFHHPQVR